MLLDIPFHEAQTVTLQLHLLSDGKVLRRTSTRYAAVNRRLTELWSQYAADQQLVGVTVLARCRPRAAAPRTTNDFPRRERLHALSD